MRERAKKKIGGRERARARERSSSSSSVFQSVERRATFSLFLVDQLTKNSFVPNQLGRDGEKFFSFFVLPSFSSLSPSLHSLSSFIVVVRFLLYKKLQKQVLGGGERLMMKMMMMMMVMMVVEGK